MHSAYCASWASQGLGVSPCALTVPDQATSGEPEGHEPPGGPVQCATSAELPSGITSRGKTTPAARPHSRLISPGFFCFDLSCSSCRSSIRTSVTKEQTISQVVSESSGLRGGLLCVLYFESSHVKNICSTFLSALRGVLVLVFIRPETPVSKVCSSDVLCQQTQPDHWLLRFRLLHDDGITPSLFRANDQCVWKDRRCALFPLHRPLALFHHLQVAFSVCHCRVRLFL
ncbi:hypothetical protein J6590_062483 [Homalodisca vitripennis]|nr:hypothetical protein J6590_062483 [Homalodisca vitripennis]